MGLVFPPSHSLVFSVNRRLRQAYIAFAVPSVPSTPNLFVPSHPHRSRCPVCFSWCGTPLSHPGLKPGQRLCLSWLFCLCAKGLVIHPHLPGVCWSPNPRWLSTPWAWACSLCASHPLHPHLTIYVHHALALAGTGLTVNLAVAHQHLREKPGGDSVPSWARSLCSTSSLVSLPFVANPSF